MAKAVIKTEKVTKSRPVETEVKTVELILTPREATFLSSLLGLHVQGTGPLKDIANDIWAALRTAGADFRFDMFTGSVFCKNDDGSVYRKDF